MANSLIALTHYSTITCAQPRSEFATVATVSAGAKSAFHQFPHERRKNSQFALSTSYPFVLARDSGAAEGPAKHKKSVRALLFAHERNARVLSLPNGGEGTRPSELALSPRRLVLSSVGQKNRALRLNLCKKFRLGRQPSFFRVLFAFFDEFSLRPCSGLDRAGAVDFSRVTQFEQTVAQLQDTLAVGPRRDRDRAVAGPSSAHRTSCHTPHTDQKTANAHTGTCRNFPPRPGEQQVSRWRPEAVH